MAKDRLFEILKKVNPELQLKEEIEQGVANPTRLNAPMKSKINRELTALPDYHTEIPLDTIEEILERYGLIILQEDNTSWSGMLMGSDSQTTFTLGYIATGVKNSENWDATTYTPIENAGLVLTWYKMQSGKWEIVTYVS